MNIRARPAGAGWRQGHMGALITLLAMSTLGGCAHTKRQVLFEKTLRLPAGRFAGPIEIDVPRRPADSLRDYEYETVLTSSCGPLLRLSYPDGESHTLGDHNQRWQELLELRAADQVEPEAPAAAPSETANVEAPATPSAAPSQAPIGHWQRVATETWPGQMEFLQKRDERCGRRKSYHHSYITALDESGRITVWAKVPQELADAELSVRVYEIIDVDRERRVAARERKREARLHARAEVKVERRPRKSKARPPQPRPKRESPKPAKAAGASWSPGHWSWHDGKGKWVWVDGYWLMPTTVPAAPNENTGAPPIAGCTWQAGHWEWHRGPGEWIWSPGNWNAPPPRQEDPGSPPVPESPWIAGYWIRTELSFKWIPGRWGKPRPRAETPPTPPYVGAHWRAGAWLMIDGKWIWSPGFYEQGSKAPPPRRTETPGPSPHPEAVWLGGYWRWEVSRKDFRWVAGHWEVPPGEGYVWIADPPDPVAGTSISGHWKLRVDIRVPVKVQP